MDWDRRAQRLLQKNMSWDEVEGGLRFGCSETVAESNEKRATRLKQQEIFIPQWSS